MLSFLYSNTPLVFFVQSLWRDEAFSYLLAKNSLLDLLFLTAKDSNPPLYYIFLHFWMKFAGHSEIALRLVSLVFFLATAYVFYLFLTQIFSRGTLISTLYMVLFFSNPLLHYYAFETRMYSMLGFFAVLSSYFMVKKKWVGYGVSAFLGAFTHYFMIFLICLQLFFLLRNTKDKKTLTEIIRIILALIISYLPWVFFVASINTFEMRNSFWLSKSTWTSLLTLPAVLLTGFSTDQWFQYPLLTPLSVLVTLIIILGFLSSRVKSKRKDNNNIFIFLSLWGLAIPYAFLLISFFNPIFAPRYVIFSTIGLLLLYAYLGNHLERKTEYICLVLLLFFSLHYSRYQILFRKKANIKKISSEIRSLMKPGDVVYVTHEFNFHPFQYYINEDQVYIYGKTYEELPWYIGKVLISPNRIASQIPHYPNKAYIVQEDLSYTIQSTD